MVPPGPDHRPTEQQQANSTEPQEEPVVHRHVNWHVTDVMDAKEMMIDDSLNQIECPPSEDQLAGEVSGGFDHRSRASGIPEQ